MFQSQHNNPVKDIGMQDLIITKTYENNSVQHLMRERERGRERERERERHTQTDRQTDRQTDTKATGQ